MKNLFLNLSVPIIGLLFLGTSCKSTYYQVYTVDTESMRCENNSMVFENIDCKVMYNLWSENGKVRFVFYNKTDRDIFLDMNQTMFVLNGYAHEYYQGRTYEVFEKPDEYSNINGVRLDRVDNDIWGNNVYKDNSFYGNTSSIPDNRVMIQEKEIICVPPKAYKYFFYYSINPKVIKTCVKNKDFPSKEADVSSFSKEDSPLHITNRITYGFDSNIPNVKSIDNSFWVSSIKNYSFNAALEHKSLIEECNYNNLNKKTLPYKYNYFKIGGPNKFYHKYIDY